MLGKPDGNTHAPAVGEPTGFAFLRLTQGGPAGNGSAASLSVRSVLPLLFVAALGASPSPLPPQPFVRHALLRAPADLRPVGALDQAAVTLDTFRSETVAGLHFAGTRVVVDAVVDLSDEATELELRFGSNVEADDAKGFRVQVHAGAALPLVGVGAERWVVGFRPEQDLPSSSLVLDARPAPVKRERGSPFECPVERVHAAPSAQSASWSPASFVWQLERLSAAKDGWTRLAVVQPAEKLTVLAFVHESAVRCGGGTGGGWLGSSGSFGAADGRVSARALRLPSGTALFSSSDGGVPVARLLRATDALEADDGSLRLTLTDGRSTLSLYGLFVDAAGPHGKGPYITHGVGSTTSRLGSGWPRLNLSPNP